MRKKKYYLHSYRITAEQAKKVKDLADYWEESESEIIRQAIKLISETEQAKIVLGK